MPGLKQNRDQNGIGSIAKNMHENKLVIKSMKKDQDVAQKQNLIVKYLQSLLHLLSHQQF